jgi:hypothetical protein
MKRNEFEWDDEADVQRAIQFECLRACGETVVIFSAWWMCVPRGRHTRYCSYKSRDENGIRIHIQFFSSLPSGK